MRCSDQVWRLIVILVAALGWGLEPVGSAQETPQQEEKQATAENAAKEAAENAVKETAHTQDADKESAKEENPGAGKSATEAAGKKESAKKSEAAAGSAAKGGDKAKAGDQGTAPADAARRQAAAVVVKHLKAAAAAIGLRDAPPAAAAAEATSASGESGEAATTVEKPRKKAKEPTPPMFRMRDGTRIAGEAELEALGVDTAYGRLEVPITEIVHVRFCSPKDSEVGARVAKLVEQLASDEFDLREEATEELRGIGVPALEALRIAAKSDDQEVKTRAEKLVAELEEELEDIEEDRAPQLVPLSGDEDEVVTLKFTIFGHIDVSHVSVKTPYGQLKLDRDDMLSIVFREPPYRQLAFEIGSSNAYAGNNKWIETGLKLTQGAFLKISAAGNLNLANYGTNSNPDGVTGVPANGLESFPVGALVARIGAKGKPFLVGSEYEGTANATGELQLGISFKSGTTRGQYQVEVEVEVEEE